jgi:ACS family tartrate transporter-like MFS transporter
MNGSPQGIEARVLPRVTRRLVSFAFICYVIAYIDRVNVGFVSTILQRELGLSNQAYGFGAGLFFFGYFLFEIPSNLILERVGARRWIARIMIVWGFVSMGTIFVTGERSFYALRFLLGLAEAGFFPGIVLYLTYWIPAHERARNGALFMMAAPVAMLVGAPLSEALLGLDGRLGFAGWQWLFLIEGLPAVLLGVLALLVLTDRPEQATWLDPEGRTWLSEQMALERKQRVAHGGAFRSLLDPKLLLLCLFYFLNTTVTYGIFLWLPRMLEESLGRRSFVLVMIPFAFALVAMVLIGRHSDKTGERKRHVAACALVAAIGLVLAAFFQASPALLVLSFTICQIGQRAIQPTFWAIPPAFLGGTAAAAGIALINSVGNLGGQLGPWVVGSLRDLTHGHAGGLLLLAGLLVLEAALVLSLRMPAREPQPAEGGGPAGSSLALGHTRR